MIFESAETRQIAGIKNLPDKAAALAIVLLAAIGFGWSYLSLLLLEREVANMGRREVTRPAPDSRVRLGAWFVECGAEHCMAGTSVPDGQGGSVSGSVAFVQVAQVTRLQVSIMVPHGIAVGRPLRISLPDFAEFELPVQRCTPVGCEAAFVPETFLILGLRRGPQMRIGFDRYLAFEADPTATSIPIQIDLPLRGLAAAIAKLR